MYDFVSMHAGSPLAFTHVKFYAYFLAQNLKSKSIKRSNAFRRFVQKTNNKKSREGFWFKKKQKCT
jgi:hypothetical protein